MPRVTVELSDDVYENLESLARRQKKRVEELLAETVSTTLGVEYGDVTEEERRGVWERALEREDLWGSEADRFWDTWAPTEPAT